MLSTANVIHHNVYHLAKRYRKKSPPRKYWRYMYRGRNPFGAKEDETEEERELREQRVLKNRRLNGKNLIDWVTMPHLQYVINNADDTKTCRMMMREWRKYPEPTYWDVTRVIPDRYDCDPNELHEEDIQQEWEDRVVATPPKKAIAYGRLTWRGVSHPDERRIPYIRWRGWVWQPCETWLQCDPTKQDNFEPYLRKEGPMSIEF